MTTIGTITVEISIDENEETGNVNISGSIDQPKDMPISAVVYAILTTLETQVRAEIEREYAEELPLGNPSITRQLTDQAARLALLHEVMHLGSGNFLVSSISD